MKVLAGVLGGSWCDLRVIFNSLNFAEIETISALVANGSAGSGNEFCAI